MAWGIPLPHLLIKSFDERRENNDHVCVHRQLSGDVYHGDLQFSVSANPCREKWAAVGMCRWTGSSPGCENWAERKAPRRLHYTVWTENWKGTLEKTLLHVRICLEGRGKKTKTKTKQNPKLINTWAVKQTTRLRMSGGRALASVFSKLPKEPPILGLSLYLTYYSHMVGPELRVDASGMFIYLVINLFTYLFNFIFYK